MFRHAERSGLKDISVPKDLLEEVYFAHVMGITNLVGQTLHS